MHDVMPLYYQAFGMAHAQNASGATVLVRNGFHAAMLRDTLGDPDVQCRRFNAFLAANGAALVDPATGGAFPVLVIPRSAFPATTNSQTWQASKQMTEAFNLLLSDYLKELRRVGRWKHDVTMAGMSDGVWVQLRRDYTFG